MRYRIHEGETLVGRGSRVAFFLDEPSVSREHAIVRRQTEVITLTDLGSSNGTFVNGERVDKSRKLELGDTVRLGAAELRFGATRGVVPPSVSPGIEFIEQQSTRPPVMDLSTEPAFGSIEVLETLVQSPESAENLEELAQMVRASVDRLLGSMERGRVKLGASECARVLAIAKSVKSWFPDGDAHAWADGVGKRLGG